MRCPRIFVAAAYVLGYSVVTECAVPLSVRVLDWLPSTRGTRWGRRGTTVVGRLLSLMLVVGLISLECPPVAVARTARAVAQQANAAHPAGQLNAGSISGVATDPEQHPLANHLVRVRSLTNGQIAGAAATNAAGEFSISGLPPGNYVAEVFDSAGNLIATSPVISLSAGAMVASGVVVTSSALSAAAAAAAVGGLSGFFASTSGILIVAAGITTAVVATRATASSSR